MNEIIFITNKERQGSMLNKALQCLKRKNIATHIYRICRVTQESIWDDTMRSLLSQARLVIFSWMGNRDDHPFFQKSFGFVKQKNVHFCILGNMQASEACCFGVAREVCQEVERYLAFGGVENYSQLWLYLSAVRGEKTSYLSPQQLKGNWKNVVTMWMNEKKRWIGLNRYSVWSVVCFIMVLMSAQAFAAQPPLELRVDVPYSLGMDKESIAPQENFMIRINVFHPSIVPEQAVVRLLLPPEIAFINANGSWESSVADTGGSCLTAQVDFAEGYGNWFDFLRLQVKENAADGDYPIQVTVESHGVAVYTEKQLIVRKQADSMQTPLSIRGIVIPFDEDGKYDSRVDQATLLLRDGEFDYFKNLLTNKGATNTAAERVHPVTNMLISFENPQAEQKVLLLKAYLLDAKTKERIPGLISPRSTADEDNIELNQHYDEIHGLAAFVALDGDPQQKVRMPVYVDEEEIKNGEVILKVDGYDDDELVVEYEMPIQVIHRDEKAAWITGVMFIFVLIALPMVLAKRRLQAMKSRWLITAALFGATAFAVVSLPTTFLSDVLHIILGPFSFFITGAFSGILLYMLVCSLLVLIPRVGIVSLMLLVKMLINMLVFGHISPISVLLVGVQAVLLEGLFYGCGLTKGEISLTKRNAFLIFMACGIADAISTYVNLQAMSFLYRLYYADWYIFLCTFISGFFYSGIGALCGLYLGKELKKVGVD